MNPIILNIGVAAAVGFVKSSVSYLAVSRKEDFDFYKFITGSLPAALGGSIVGATVSSPLAAALAALAADDLRSAAHNFMKK